MAEFLEERLPIDIRMGAMYADEFDVQIVQTAGGEEYRSLRHPFPVRNFTVHYTLETADLWDRIVSLYHRAFGMYAGFRVFCLDDCSTNGNTGTPTATDQTLGVVTAGSVYQLKKSYGAGATPLSIGLPYRTIYKPVAGTTRIAIGSLEVPTSGFSVDTTTGRVTFSADKTGTVTGITQAAQAVVTLGTHTYLVGDLAYFSGVVGMTQINGLRGLVVAKDATTITVAIDSSVFSAYSSGGTVHSRPQAGETVYGGCQFDLPCRFNSRIDIEHVSRGVREAGDIDLIELVAP